ncbi:IPT/TIG domain-containing protein [Alkaliphilus serpentinus]|uniref:Fibronectin type-III domain-containing protein n=1 Tax=Alkaliphilus serpentinus TaxID=1482731 RepID=A0A833HQI6_9FIRM|nr:IPT/TIG domain-containing protein [Alkaliphilus serpentinus]KAB3531864.1 hypothetical protein F8153_03865 [Alkaliphilus serpentinus]
MRRKLAMLATFIMLFNTIFTTINIEEVYGAVTPTVDSIVIEEEVRVVNGQRVTSYSVNFNGYPLNNVTAIRVRTTADPADGAVKTLTGFTKVGDGTSDLLYTPSGAGQTLASIFGTTGNVYFGVIADGVEYITNKAFLIPPDSNVMKVDYINGLSPASWPINVNKGEDLKVQGTHFTNPAIDDPYYKLGITTGDFVASEVPYTSNLTKDEIDIDTSSEYLNAGQNLNLIFQKKSGSFVTIRYVVRDAVNIANPLNLGDVSVSPLRGTSGTIVRIRANNHIPLLDAGTKVYIGGIEANRNVSSFSDGTFDYTEGGDNKKGIEVVVPALPSTGVTYPIVIRNLDGDTYQHDQGFYYEAAPSSLLNIIGINPDKAYTNEEQLIDGLRIQNLVVVNNIDNYGTISNTEEGTTGVGSNLNYFKNDDDPKSYYIKYELAEPNHFIERKITVNIALKANITNVPLALDAPQGITTIEVVTDKVGLAGTYEVTARTETIYYQMDGTDLVELQYRVEEAPYSQQNKVNFIFEPDITTPTITSITPNKGPYAENIVATITGQNFRVIENIDGNRYYPTIVLGTQSITSDGKYKVITKNTNGETITYLSPNSNGNDVVDGSYQILPDVEFLVLDAQNNIVDGKFRQAGTKIKFTIPAGLGNFSGFADLHVYNPSPSGGLGGKDTVENIFEYVSPGPDVLWPVIESATPNKVAVGKQEQVTIKGRNFQPDAILTVDGEVVQNRSINVVTGTITFNAPAGRVGKTFIQIINPDGGFASTPFEFIQTFSQPYIQSIIPNTGGKGSLVIIKGTGFFPADPALENDDRRMGTRVYIDGKDINREYYRVGDVPEGDLELRPFVNDYYPDEDGNPIPIYGPDGQVLQAMGSNVVVVDNNTIYVLIPDPKDVNKSFFMNTPLDVRVVNPDLGSHTVNGGFRFVDVVTRPQINNIIPNLGDYRGGNIVEIQGENLLEGVKVYFGTQLAEVYRRSNNARTLWAYVPPYGEDMGNENEKMVPVTVQNTNGGSFTKFDGYKYVNPGYDVTITKLTPAIGNTAGGDRILISGVNFRAKNYGSLDVDNPEELPAVYFGGIRVPSQDITFVIPPKGVYQEVETTDLIIVENTPANPAGRVDVTVINFDGATANLKSSFEYRSKQPVINQVLPSQGSLYGNSEITIVGRDFVEKGLHVVFGNEVGSTDVLSGQATVKLGDIIVRYNAYEEDNITLQYKELDNPLEVYLDGEENPVSSFHIVEEEEFKIARINWSSIPGGENSYLADENIKIEVKDSNLIVTRRIGVIKRVEGEERITLLTPPAASVGKTQLTVFNYDGKNAKKDFTYTNPFRPPVITEITPVATKEVDVVAGVNYSPPISIDVATAAPSGGSPLIIEGSNFRAGVKVYIGDEEAEVRTKSANDDELIIVVPEAVDGTVGQYLRILIVNEDGGFAYGDVVPDGQSRNPYYFQYITEGSDPTITSVVPNEGPVTGGTRVTITGTEFKDEDTFGVPKDVTVLIGGIPVPQDDVTYINPQTLEVILPEGRVGPQTIEVINYDHGRAVAEDALTYISQPTITLVDPGKLFTNDIDTEVTITGTMFQSGAKLYIGATLVPIDDVEAGDTVHATGIRGVTTDHKNREMAVVGGVAAASVAFESETTLKVKFNEALDLTNSHIIIVNPDGGLSSEYKDFEYRIPIPTRPLVLEAIPGAEASVTLIWSDSQPEILNRADRYEIYGKKANETEYTFIGDTRDHEFLVKGLEINTDYSFMVRAMNRYGSALEFAEVKVRTLNEREDQQLREKLEELDEEDQKLKKEGHEEINGSNVVRTIGVEEISQAIPAYVIDFSLEKYKNQSSYTVAIPVEVILNLNRKLTITDGRMSFTFLPKDLYTREVSKVSVKDLEDAHVRVTFTRMSGEAGEGLLTAISRRQRRASDIYELSLQLQVAKEICDINSMLRNGVLSINFDSMAYPMANKDKLYVGQYDMVNHSFTKVDDGNSASIRNKGRYVLLANR